MKTFFSEEGRVKVEPEKKAGRSTLNLQYLKLVLAMINDILVIIPMTSEPSFQRFI